MLNAVPRDVYFFAGFFALVAFFAALGFAVFLVVALGLVDLALGLAVFLGPAFFAALGLVAFFAFYNRSKIGDTGRETEGKK